MVYWVGTSWKMNKTLAEALAFAEALAGFVPGFDERIQPFVIPPFTAVREVKAALAATRVKVGAQNMHWADAGAWTGEVSPLMLTDCGLDLVELGHSERREHFGETDRDRRAEDGGGGQARAGAADLRRRNACRARRRPGRCRADRAGARRAAIPRRRGKGRRDPVRLRAGLGDRRQGHSGQLRLCRQAAGADQAGCRRHSAPPAAGALRRQRQSGKMPPN